MLPLFFPALFAALVLPIAVHGGTIFGSKNDVKRQVSLSDIIQGALNFVRPIIGNSELPQSDLMAPRKLRTEELRERDAEILGLPKYSALDDIPFCKSNSKICKFITCTAHNFQNDESISNLNLAAQILSDTKLRKAITSNPTILLTACQEQGLSSAQCKIFANAFQIIDRFISTIEPIGTAAKRLHNDFIKADPYYDDSDVLPIPIQPGAYQNKGSQTWSTHKKNITDSELASQRAQLKEKNLSELRRPESPLLELPKHFLNPSKFSNLNTATKLVAQNALSTPSTSFTFPPLIFTIPSFATVAPMISHTLSPIDSGREVSPHAQLLAKQLQMLMPHFGNKLLLPNMIPLPPPLIILPDQINLKHPMDLVRNKRSEDYYDNIENEDNAATSTGTSVHQTFRGDEQLKFQKLKNGRKSIFDCIKILKDS